MCQQDRFECYVEVLLGVLANCPSVFEHAWLLWSMLWDFNAIQQLGLLAQHATVTIGEWYPQQSACMFPPLLYAVKMGVVVWYCFCTLP